MYHLMNIAYARFIYSIISSIRKSAYSKCTINDHGTTQGIQSDLVFFWNLKKIMFSAGTQCINTDLMHFMYKLF